MTSDATVAWAHERHELSENIQFYGSCQPRFKQQNNRLQSRRKFLSWTCADIEHTNMEQSLDTQTRDAGLNPWVGEPNAGRLHPRADERR
jgi:hypothetical protein